ncbi:MAG: 6-phosphofructokinase, partial [Acholeplasmataceae bacterium]|nr:6-phosphofructokinase [Acholeplasmataceae bacterium]
AVRYAVEGYSDKMVVFKRDPSSKKYKINYELIALDAAANTEKTIPLNWIKEDRTGLTQDFYDYALPLIQGDPQIPMEDGLPRFARLKKIYAKK